MITAAPFLITGLTFVWAGCIASISFMEAWLKFKAPGVTLEIGLSIGKLVFSVLNKVEIIFAVMITLALLARGKFESAPVFISAVVILTIQACFFLPALKDRALLIIEGKRPPKSYLHFVYLLLELLKFCSLIIFGYKQLIQWKT